MHRFRGFQKKLEGYLSATGSRHSGAELAAELRGLPVRIRAGATFDLILLTPLALIARTT